MPRRPTLKDAINAARQMPSLAGESFRPTEPAAAQSEVRCGVLVRVSDDLRRRLKVVAIQRGTTVQTLLLEAIDSRRVVPPSGSAGDVKIAGRQDRPTTLGVWGRQ